MVLQNFVLPLWDKQEAHLNGKALGVLTTDGSAGCDDPEARMPPAVWARSRARAEVASYCFGGGCAMARRPRPC